MTKFNVGDEVRFVGGGTASVPEYRGVVVGPSPKGYRVRWTIEKNRSHEVDYPPESLELIRPAKEKP